MASSPQRVLVVSIDGVAPRFVDRSTMPVLCRLALSGASTFQARTVVPSITLPAHISLLRGIHPDVHGVPDNTVPETPLDDRWPSFLSVARATGLRTAALLNWQAINWVVEPDAVDERWFLDAGYGPDDDRRIADAADVVLAHAPDVAFAYLVAPDNAGHAHGWGSDPYLDALRAADEQLGRVLAAAGDGCAVIVTTDHGGHGNDHCSSVEVLDTETFVVIRADGVAPAHRLTAASILDVAPTVAALAGFEPAPSWSGRSLLDRCEPIVDHLLGLIESMADHTYGEDLTMLAHSLQAATAVAQSANATDDLAIAALLHDIGHVLGEAGPWGLPDHAAFGATYLQQWLPPSVVEPIRLHVAAKRYLVATEPDYELSLASQKTLELQGGPFDETEAASFIASPGARHALALRRADDAGKDPSLGDANLGLWRPVLERVLTLEQPDPRWLRDACGSPASVDPFSGQRLLAPADLEGWSVIGQRGGNWVLGRPDGTTHVVEIRNRAPAATAHQPLTAIARHQLADTDAIAHDVAVVGAALIDGLGTEPGTVLEVADRLGHVRSTNYGTLFDVRNEPDAENLASTSLALGLHTDNPYRTPAPTVQLLHCLVAASGGSSRLVDGFAAANAFRAAEPGAFDVLATTPVEFRFRSSNADMRATRTLISVGASGDVDAVVLNHRSMLAPRRATAERFYDAYLAFVALVEGPDFAVHHHLAPGELLIFDNLRVLHARTAFDANEPRHLQGCYIDIDALRSHAARTSTASDIG